MENRLLKEKLIQKIKRSEGAGQESAGRRAEMMMKVCPNALRQNLVEWSEDRLLSDIRIEGYCVVDVMNIQRCDFLGAVWILSQVARDPSRTSMIWRMRR